MNFFMGMVFLSFVLSVLAVLLGKNETDQNGMKISDKGRDVKGLTKTTSGVLGESVKNHPTRRSTACRLLSDLHTGRFPNGR